MRFVSSVVTLGLLALGAGCSSSDEGSKTPTNTAAPDAGIPATTTPKNLIKTECRFNVPRSLEGDRYTCYDLEVPENRSVPESRTIKVHTIVFKGKAGGTPTFELNGGPGGPSEDLAVGLAAGMPTMLQEVGRFLEVGDYVMIDQRGTGRSLPRLACDVYSNPDPIANSRECVEKHKAAGVDLAGYVTAENADDLHDLKVALGAAKVNLHAISYGTRLALEALRRHPEDVASAIIDGVMPAQARALGEGDYNIDRLLAKIFADCAADAKCNAAYPNLDKAFSDAKKKLDATPFTFQGQPYDFYAFWGELSQYLYAEGFAGEVPQRITDVVKMTNEQFNQKMQKVIAEEEASWAAMDAALGQTPLGKEVMDRQKSDPDPEASGMADGMYLAVVCNDYAQYESLDEALSLEAQVRAELRQDEGVRQTFASCEPFPKRAKSADVFAAVTSDLPVLAVAGVYDPVTPPKWRDLAAETLSKSQKLTMGAGAHGAMNACAMGVKLAFMNAPGAPIDPSCGAAEKITFTYDDAAPGNFHRRHGTSNIKVPVIGAASIARHLRGERVNAPHLIPQAPRVGVRR